MGNYTEIAEFITTHGSRPELDRQELFRRVVFSLLVSNTDDHLKSMKVLDTGAEHLHS